MNRREFLAASAALGACAFCGCAAVNSAPAFEAGADGTLPFPAALDAPGSQVKVRLSGDTVLVWKTGEGLGAASITCPHRGSEVAWNAAEKSLDCPSHGSRFHPDGSVRNGPAKKGLKPYRATRDGGRLRIEP